MLCGCRTERLQKVFTENLGSYQEGQELSGIGYLCRQWQKQHTEKRRTLEPEDTLAEVLKTDLTSHSLSHTPFSEANHEAGALKIKK